MFPEKSPILVENTCRQRMFTTKQKKAIDIKNIPGYIQYADA